MQRKSQVALVILVIAILSAILIAYEATSQSPQNALQKAIENCEKSATTGTYTFTSLTTTEVSGANSTITITSVTTQVQVCT